MSEREKEHENEVLPTLYARDLEVERPEERWLLKDLWGRRAVGWLGGQPKLGKTWLGLDLALSVASGTPALGRFPVEAPGRALVYVAEDAPSQVRARLEALCRHRQLDLNELDLRVITVPSLRLDTRFDQKRLWRTIERLEPRLLLLDPLIRIHSLDENDAQEVSALLGYFRELQRAFDLAIVLVHHTSKKSRSQPGQALRGSSDLHAFADSSAYLARRGDELLLTVEHRAARAPQPMTLALVSTPGGVDTHLELTAQLATESQEPPLSTRLLQLLNHSADPLRRTDLRAQLRVNNQRLGEALRALEKSGEICRTARGWALNTNNSSEHS
jgi:hypothetical protein